MKLKTLAEFLTLGVGTPITSLLQSMEIDGNLIPAASVVNMLTALNNFNIADSAVNFQTTAAASITLTAIQNLTQRLTLGGAVTVTIDSAYNIVLTMPRMPPPAMTIPMK